MDKVMQGNIEVPEEYQSVIGNQEESTEENEDSNLQGQHSAKVSTSPAAPVYLGGRRFENMDELAAYTSELQNKTSRYEIEREANTISPAMANANQPKVSDLLFSDPEAFVQIIEENAEKRVMSKVNQANTEKQVWDNFYNKYPELKDKDLSPMVQFQFESKKNQLAHLPADQLLDTIGKDVRSLLNKVRGRPEGGKELPSGAAVVASSSNNSSSAKANAVKSEPETFAQQIKRFQKRGK